MQPGSDSAPSPHVAPLRYVTEDVPPLGGRLKDRPEDFLVEEIAAYEPCGEGEHVYLLVEKRGLSTMQLVRIIAEHFGVRPEAVGFAGLKDKQAITRQVLSVHVPGKRPEDFPMLRHDRAGVLWVDLHTNKLRRGHLKGNRFVIRLRGIDAMRVRDAKRALDKLAAVGLPNRLGEQRFGTRGRNHIIGRALAVGDYEGAARTLLEPDGDRPGVLDDARRLCAEGRFKEAARTFPRSADLERRIARRLGEGDSFRRAVKSVGRRELEFFVTAFQSAVFNAVLDERLERGALGSLQAGDVAFKHENGALFDVDDAVARDPETASRLIAFEISPSGPMWGPEMKRAGGQVEQAELQALAGMGVAADQIASGAESGGLMLKGARRPLRVPVTHAEVSAGVDEHGHYIRFAFDLPRGAFATSVMQEIMKSERLPDTHTDRGARGISASQPEGDRED